MEKKKLISIIIPLYNESHRFPKLFTKSFLKIKQLVGNFELILVDDGSTDTTLEYLNKVARKNKNIKVVTYLNNMGKGYALKKGVERAKGDIIGFMDADFAISLDEIPKFLKKIENRFDLVIGDRHSNQSETLVKPSLMRLVLGQILGLVNNFFLNLGNIKDTQCGFKFFEGAAAKSLFNELTINRWLFDLEILLGAKKLGYKISHLPIQWKGVEGSKVSINSDFASVLKDLIKIYFNFYNLRIHILVLLITLIFILTPFFITPENLVRRNGDWSDIVWPNYYFVKESILKYQQIPLWNPTLFSGIPEIANPQSPIIYPPNYLILLLPVDISIVLLILIHSLMAGVFIYLTCASLLKWTSLASCITSLAFVFSPFIWGKIAVGHLSQAFAIFLLAPILYFSILIFKKLTLKRLFILSVLLSLQYLNYPTIWYYSCFFGVIFIFYLAFIYRRGSVLWLLFAPIISLIIISPIFLIQLSAGQFITRTQLTLTDLSIPLWSIKRFLASVVIPSNLLNDLETEVWLYPSIMILTTALLAFVRLNRKFKFLFFSLIFLIILITLGSRTPLFGLLTDYIPGFSYLRVSTRVWFVLIIMLGFLAGFYINSISNIKVKIILTSLLFLDLFGFSALRIWDIPKIMRYSQNSDLVNLISKSSFRYYCTSRCLSARETLPLGINTADGYHLLILNNYRNKLSEAGGFLPPKYTGNIPSTDDRFAQPIGEKLGKFGVKWVISDYSLNDENFVEIKNSGKYILYQNQKIQNRVRLENSLEGDAQIVYDSPNKVEVKVTSELSDYLILADTYFPGWKVYVDGVETQLEIYDDWARMVLIQKGVHQVEFKYKPFSIIYEYI